MARAAGHLSVEARAAQDEHVLNCSACAELLDVLETQTRRVAGNPSERSGTLGRYELIRLLGMGGMGMVYAARDPSLERDVAIKLVRAVDEESNHAHLLEQEARAMAQIRHPNVARVFEVGRTGGEVFVAMELIEGKSLKEWIRQEQPDRATRYRLLVEAGRGLQAVHAAGLVHRDFKTSNILIQPGPNGPTAIVIDFGLSTPAPEESQSDEDARTERTSRQSPRIVGTPAYMAPEQIDHGLATAASDQFAYAVTLVEVLTGARPFPGRTLSELRASMDRGLPRAQLRASGVPAAARRVVEKALRLDPAGRWPNMDALLDEFVRGINGSGRRRRRGLALVASLAVSGGVFAVSEHLDDPCRVQRARMGEVWNPERRQALAQNILGTETEGRTRFAEQATVLVDDYVEHWQERHAGACAASNEGYRVCLRRRLDVLDASLEFLADTKLDDSGHVVDLLYTLPSVADCTEDSTVPVGTPHVTSAERMESAQRGAQARALVGVGEYDAAAQVVDEAANTARKSGDDLGLAQALLTRGRIWEYQGDLERAKSAWTECLAKARGVDAYVSAAACGAQLALYGRRSDANSWATQAVADAERSAAPVVLANTLGLAAVVAFRNNDLAKASQYVQRAQLVLSRAKLSKTDADVDSTVSMIGAMVFARQGRTQEAIELQRAVVAERTARSGRVHPDTAFATLQLAKHLSGAGLTTQAVVMFEEAVELTRATEPAEGPMLGQALVLFGYALLQVGDTERATRMLTEAATILEAFGEPAGVAMGQGALAEAALANEQPQRAIVAKRKAVDALRQASGGEHPDTAISEVSLARTLLEHGGSAEDAVALLEHGAAILDRNEDPVRKAIGLDGFGTLALHRGDAMLAVSYHRRALQVWLSNDADGLGQIDTRLHLALALAEAGDEPAARSTVEELDSTLANAGERGYVLDPPNRRKLERLRLRLTSTVSDEGR